MDGIIIECTILGDIFKLEIDSHLAIYVQFDPFWDGPGRNADSFRCRKLNQFKTRSGTNTEAIAPRN